MHIDGDDPVEQISTSNTRVKTDGEKTRPSRPIGATCRSSNECVTDQPTNRPTDTASYRCALSHLKSIKIVSRDQYVTVMNCYI